MFVVAVAVFSLLAQTTTADPATADAVATTGAKAAADGTAEWIVAGLVLFGLLPALWYYGRIAWRTFRNGGRVDATGFGPAEAGVAGALVALLLAIIAGGFAVATRDGGTETKLPEGQTLVVGVLVDTAVKTLLVAALCSGLALRGRNPAAMFGLSQPGFGRVLGTSVVLLLAALPVVYAFSFVAEWLTGGAGKHGPEEAVRLLLSARDPASRLAMVGAAVVVAPVVEEFLFRGYLYGVMRRYLGFAGGVVLNSALFAGIHLHVPSLAPLFVFAVLLTLAYEHTGNLLVPMAMHAMFNALSVTMLILGVGET